MTTSRPFLVHPTRPPFAPFVRREVVHSYFQLLRVDHAFKNAFMLLGIVLAIAHDPAAFGLDALPRLFAAALATCLVASSNYVLNEWLDAPSDRHHPTKCDRPAARGLVERGPVLALWLTTAAIGAGIAFAVNVPLGCAAVSLWVMGCIYNVPPVRAKDVAYLDVLSESINNPIRLLLGWFALAPTAWPPVALILSYWMVGAFFMATKRLAELRNAPDRAALARYRLSFAHYDETKLLVSMAYTLVLAATLGGVFVVQSRVELLWGLPLYAGLFAWYFALGLLPDSPVQFPERLYRQRGFLVYTVATFAIFTMLLFVDMPNLAKGRAEEGAAPSSGAVAPLEDPAPIQTLPPDASPRPPGWPRTWRAREIVNREPESGATRLHVG